MEEEAGKNLYEDIFSVFYLLKKQILDFHSFAETGELTRLHLGTLGVLSRAGTLPVSELAQRLHVSKPQMTVTLDKLSGMGLVERLGSLTDRRVVEVSIKPSGRSVLDSSMERIREKMRGSLDLLTPEELSELKRSLLSLSTILSKL